MGRKQRGNLLIVSGCFKNKKGQITLFIVIGLVILSLVIGVLVLREKAIVGELGLDDIIEVPGELQPVHNFITDIVYDVAVEGLVTMGLQGGWISIDDSSLSGQTFFTHPDPTSSEILTLHSMNVPYWYFMISPNDCISGCDFSTKGNPGLKSWSTNPGDRVASDTSVEAQLDRYLEERLKEEFEISFASLEDQGYEISGAEDITVITIVGEEDVAVSVSYEIVIDGPTGKGKLKQYFVRIPIDIMEVFNLVNEIINVNTEYNFLEQTFLNWINIYQGITGELPPVGQFDIGGTPEPWVMSNVKTFIRDSLFVPFIQAIQLQDTKNYETNLIEGDENDNLFRIRRGIITSLEPKFLSKPYDLSVDFFYHPGWDIYLNVDPHDGELIIPNNLDNNIMNMFPVSIQKYEFYYDVSVPILVIVRDDDALNGDGYTFQFAIEANIRSNAPMSPGVAVNLGGVQQQTLFDNQRQWISGNVTIEAVDNFGNPIDDVLVQYSCGSLSVTIGRTEINDEGKAVLVSKFPVSCSAGLLSLTRVGYLGYGALRFDPQIGEEAYILAPV